MGQDQARPNPVQVNADGEGTPASFPCSSCGACCRRVSFTMLFPRDWIRPDGSCVHLAGSTCSIYERRPEICRIDHMIERRGLDRDWAYAETARLCNAWMDEDGVETSKRIRLPVIKRNGLP